MLLDPELMRKAGAFGLVSIELAAYQVGGFLLGRYLDGFFGFHHALDIGLTIIGLIIAIVQIVRWYGEETKKDKKK